MSDDQKVTREAFATEQDWIAYLQYQVEVQRQERMRLTRQAMEAAHSRAESKRIHALRRRMKQRQYERAYHLRHPDASRENNRRYRERHPDAARKATRRWREKIRANPWRNNDYLLKRAVYRDDHRQESRDYSRRWRQEHPEQARHHFHLYRQRHLDKMRAKDRAYGREHRDEKLAYMRERYLQTHPDARTGAEVAAEARRFAQRVEELRAAGLKWREVAERLNRSVRACMMARSHERKRQGVPAYQEARQLEAEVVEARTAGFTWSEVSALVSRPIGTCFTAYKRAMQRQQQHGGEASA